MSGFWRELVPRKTKAPAGAGTFAVPTARLLVNVDAGCERA